MRVTARECPHHIGPHSSPPPPSGATASSEERRAGKLVLKGSRCYSEYSPKTPEALDSVSPWRAIQIVRGRMCMFMRYVTTIDGQ